MQPVGVRRDLAVSGFWAKTLLLPGKAALQTLGTRAVEEIRLRRIAVASPRQDHACEDGSVLSRLQTDVHDAARLEFLEQLDHESLFVAMASKLV